MKKLLSLTAAVGFTFLLNAQDGSVKELQGAASKTIAKDPKDTTVKTWKKGGLFTFNVAQGSLDNWVGGGDKFSFSAVSFLNLYAFYKKDKHNWDNSLDLGYGFIKTTSLGQRKSDDRIDFLSKYGYSIAKKWNAGVLFNFRSQFANGYAYGKTPAGAEIKTITSKLFAPAYVLLSLGLDYKPNDNFSVFISPLTERWIIVADDSLSAKGAYGVTPGKKVKNELGAFLSAKFSKEVAKNIVFTSRLDLFSNYKKKPQNMDLFWTNVLTMKVNKFISANVSLDLLYDDDAISRLQRRQLLGIGMSAKF
jgi:Protein of unknown function (DUF3078)